MSGEGEPLDTNAYITEDAFQRLMVPIAAPLLLGLRSILPGILARHERHVLLREADQMERQGIEAYAGAIEVLRWKADELLER